MKKVGAYFVLALIALVFVSNFVSAASASDALKPIVDMVGGAVNAVIDIIKPWAGMLLNETDTNVSNDVFMGKLLAVILIISIVYVVLSKTMDNFFSGKKWALWLVSAAVSLLGVRFLTKELIYMMVLPSNAFAIAVTAGIPFILFFFLIEGFSPRVRRYAWIFFGVMFFVVWSIRADAGVLAGIAAGVYFLVAILSWIMAVLDGTIRGFFLNLKMEKAKRGLNGGRVAILQRKLVDVEDLYSDLLDQGQANNYQGSSPDGAGKMGEHAYLLDKAYYEKKLRLLLKSI